MKRRLITFAAPGFWLVSAAIAMPQSVPEARGAAHAPLRIVGQIGPAAGAQKPSTSTVAIPPNAVKLDEQHYRAKDANGVEWIYTKTPFGINKGRADEAVSQPSVKADPALKVSVDGDEARFERRTPFGVNVWTKKLLDLTPEEKKLVASVEGASSTTSSKANVREGNAGAK